MRERVRCTVSSNKRAKVEHREADGQSHSVELQTQVTDTPILPVEHMERFQRFRPEVNDWILAQTTQESEHRRAYEKRVAFFVFIERVAGQIFGFLIGIGGITGGAAVAIYSSPRAGAAIACVAIGTLAVAFLKSQKE